MSHCSSCSLANIPLMERFENNVAPSTNNKLNESKNTCKGLSGNGCVYTAQGELVCSKNTTSVENFIDKFLDKNKKK